MSIDNMSKVALAAISLSLVASPNLVPVAQAQTQPQVQMQAQAQPQAQTQEQTAEQSKTPAWKNDLDLAAKARRQNKLGEAKQYFGAALSEFDNLAQQNPLPKFSAAQQEQASYLVSCMADMESIDFSRLPNPPASNDDMAVFGLVKSGAQSSSPVAKPSAKTQEMTMVKRVWLGRYKRLEQDFTKLFGTDAEPTRRARSYRQALEKSLVGSGQASRAAH